MGPAAGSEISPESFFAGIALLILASCAGFLIWRDTGGYVTKVATQNERGIFPLGKPENRQSRIASMRRAGLATCIAGPIAVLCLISARFL